MFRWSGTFSVSFTLACNTGVNHVVDTVQCFLFNFLIKESNDQMIQSVNVLKEMIDVRDCVKECAILNMDDVMYIINDICLN